MNQKHYLLVVCLIIIAFPLAAQSHQLIDTNMEVSIEDGKLVPKGKLPIKWSDNFSSYIAYRGNQNIEFSSLLNEPSSFQATSIEETRLAFGLLSYQDILFNNKALIFSLGLELEKIKIKAQDRGYYFKQDEAKVDNFYPVELDRSIKVNRVNLPLDLQYADSYFSHRVSLILASHSSLKLNQNLFAPEFASDNKFNSDKRNQKLAWQTTYEGIWLVNPYIAPGWAFGFEELPLDYDTLSITSSGEVGIARESTKLQTLTSEARLYWLNTASNNKAKTYLGYRAIKNKANGVSSETIKAVVFGVDSRF